MKAAVIGHVEWIRFARVEHAAAPGEIVHSTEEWEQAGGGGGVAAIQLALLADEAHLFTVLGDDDGLVPSTLALAHTAILSSQMPRFLTTASSAWMKSYSSADIFLCF